MDTKKVKRSGGNVIDFHADAKEMLKSSKQTKDAGNNKIAKVKRTEVVRGLAQPSRKIDFLNDQLGTTKNELSLSRQNHNALVDQIIFAQKDFKRRLRAASEERRVTEEKYNKVSSAFFLKEKEAIASAKKVEELKEKFSKLHATYTEKIEKFKEQHKTRIEGRETLAEKKMKILLIEKEKMQKSVNYLMDSVYKRSEKLTALEKDLKKINEEKFDLVQINESLIAFKEENQYAVKSLQGELKVLKQELEETVGELKEKETSLDQTSFKLKSALEDLGAATIKAKDFQHNFFKMQNEVEVKRSKIESYEQTISELCRKEKEMNNLSDEVRSFQISEASLQGEIHSLKEKEENYKKQIDAQDQTLGEYKDNIKNLERSLQALQKEFNESNQKFNDQINGYEKEIIELNSVKKNQEEAIQNLKRSIATLKVDRDDKSNEIQTLGAKLDKLEDLNERYANECTSLEEHIAVVTSELKSTKEQGNASIANIKGLNEKIFALSSEFLDSKEERENLSLQVSDLNTRIESEQSKYQFLEGELLEKEQALSEAKDREVEFMEAKLEWEDDREVLELRISDFTKSVEEKGLELIQKQDKIEEYLKQFRDVNGELDRVKKEVSSFETEKLALVKGTESLVSKNEELTYKKSQLESIVRDNEAKETKLRNQINELEKKVFTEGQTASSFEKKLAEAGEVYASELKVLKDENESLIRKQQELRHSRQSTDAEIADSNSVLEETRKSLAKVKKETQKYKDQIKALEASNKEKDLAIADYEDLKAQFKELSSKEDKSEDALEKRRKELGLYSRWVDSQKESLKNNIVRFTQELKLSLTINPLHSYLSMTEKELTKVELLLARPGVLGEQRSHLEGHHKILVEQKKYISEMVAKTKSDVEKRVREVAGLLKQGDFIPVPPLPPKKKS